MAFKDEFLQQEYQKHQARKYNLHTMPYQDYLKTAEWQRTQQTAIRAAGATRQRCRSQRRIEVHHLTYERRGCEYPTDMVVLCEKCHDLMYKKQS